MNSNNYTIVGWGLAGATMAWQLYFRKINFKVYDNQINTCTNAAAGIVNPIVFKRLSLSWNATILLPAAAAFFNKIESELAENILDKKSIYKIFNSIEEENNWAAKKHLPLFKEYLGESNNMDNEAIINPHGAGEVKTIGNLNTQKFLSASKEFFLKNEVDFRNKNFDYTSIKLAEQKIIFCEGANIDKNPFFNYLPLKPTHGEVLIIKTPHLKIKDIINKNMFVMPLGNDLYKIGATYNWEITLAETSENGKNELIEKLKGIIDVPYEMIDHLAGIRPTVSDRRPLLGVHPRHSNLFVFNGLGTKGVMLAPFYSMQLLDFMEQNMPIDNEVNIIRYEKYLN